MSAGYGMNACTLYSAKVYPVGYTVKNGCGCGSEVWQRWALVPTLADGRPALRWRDGKPRHVGPRVSGKVAPQWLNRAAAFVSRCGPLTLHELDGIADWYRTNARKGGEPDLDSFIPF